MRIRGFIWGFKIYVSSLYENCNERLFCYAEKMLLCMNIKKYYILVLFLFCSMFMSSQRQHGILESIIIDTDTRPDKAENSIIVKNGSKYNCGDIPCDGFHADYYDKNNNKLRLTGFFKKGMPVDTIKEYFENGVVKFIYYPYKRKYKYGGRKYNYCLYME